MDLYVGLPPLIHGFLTGLDVTIFSAFTALSTIGSIIQQIHYATSWLIIKEAQFNKAVQSLHHPGLAFGGAAQPVDVVLFFIRKLVDT